MFGIAALFRAARSASRAPLHAEYQSGRGRECQCCSPTYPTQIRFSPDSMAIRFVLCIAAALGATAAQAQKLPAPSRDVFRCEINGNVSYSDSPCLGAKKVDVEPTRGLDASSGRVQTGADVRKERFHEEFAEAFRPATGKDAKQLKVDAKRLGLPPSAQRQCRQLDEDIPTMQERERHASRDALPLVQQLLLEMRQRFIQLGC
ncbi:hypothetical protein [Rubrivivax sp. JA1055]|uniref:hypothetical protein n=2 Tax=unclassified Rubrivivax TaxID=2649762 RepID=UPI001E42A805|nr:hypothetical protein [Rubrivivax sp. JA1055]